MKVQTDNPQHAMFESEIADFVIEHGGVIQKAGYHDVYHDGFVELIRLVDDETSQYVRTRKDHVAVFEAFRKSILIDAKTCNRRCRDASRNDFCIEARPLAHAIAMANCGVTTVFCCKMLDHSFGFVADSIVGNIISEIKFPSFRNELDDIREFVGMYQWIFPNAQFNQCGGGGSGDPFCVIRAADLHQFPSWQDAITVASGMYSGSDGR